MTKAIVIHEQGGTDVMKWEDSDPGDPGPGQVRIKHTAVGLNYIDILHRNGVYPFETPGTFGIEGSGVIEAVGDGVDEISVGQRIAYGVAPPGAYAEARLVPAARIVALPDAIDDNTGAAMMLKGITAQYLIRRLYKVEAGETVLLHAAAGGVGLIACQWLKHLGATVIGTVGSDEKAELAKAHGCDHPVVYTRDSFVDKVKEVTDGKGVPVVYDSVGKATLDDSLDCLALRGLLVNFGFASGMPGPFDLGALAAKGSLFITRPTVVGYTSTREELLESTNDLIDAVTSGIVKIEINQTYALKDAAQAHTDLEGRKTTGCSVLLP